MELVLTNSIPIDLIIDHINLIIESTEFELKFIELFNLNETKDRSFIIPSLADDFIIELGFILSHWVEKRMSESES